MYLTEYRSDWPHKTINVNVWIGKLKRKLRNKHYFMINCITKRIELNKQL